MVARSTFIGASVAAVALGVAVAGTTGASNVPRPHTYQQINLVSDQPNVAASMDPDLVNAWGISHGPNTPVWVSDNGTGLTTLYRTDTPGSPVTKVLTVTIPGGDPTGQLFNDTSAFPVPGNGQAARFIFVTENGDVSAWNGGSTAVSVNPPAHDAVYKGVTLAHGPSGPTLLAADFHNNRIDVYDASFNLVSQPGMFTDRHLPAGYAPFNVAEINGQVFVTYAKQDADRHDDVAGPGHGFIDVYTDSGAFVKRFATHGVLNSPWGMTIAPATFGQFAGDLLVGNFGDGHIHAFNPRTGAVLGIVRGTSGAPLTIDGLWALVVGDMVAGGPDAIWFSAGPDGEAHGLLGLLEPAGR
jgi:uncharacterized protein (TIGR03118 family)